MPSITLCSAFYIERHGDKKRTRHRAPAPDFKNSVVETEINSILYSSNFRQAVFEV